MMWLLWDSFNLKGKVELGWNSQDLVPTGTQFIRCKLANELWKGTLPDTWLVTFAIVPLSIDTVPSHLFRDNDLEEKEMEGNYRK